MYKEIFKVFFAPSTDEGTKNRYLDVIKNEWGYPSVSNFLNVIVNAMADEGIIILKVDKLVIKRLLEGVRKKNYSDIEDWFRSKIREELNES